MTGTSANRPPDSLQQLQQQQQPTTIFSEYQKKVQVVGDVTYRLRVRLIHEETVLPAESAALRPESSGWDLDIPFDLTMFMKLSGGQSYVGNVTSGLYFPPSFPWQQPPPSMPSSANKPTIEKLSSTTPHPHPTTTTTIPNTTTSEREEEEEEKDASTALDHSFYLRVYGLLFQNRTNLQSFPTCSVFTATRYPEIHQQLEQEVASMKIWLQMKLQYSFHHLLRVIFDLESIRQYERIFSLIMKVSCARVG